MSYKTETLREVIATNIKTVIDDCYYVEAPTDKPYPFAVYSFERQSSVFLDRDDLVLVIDIYSKSINYKEADRIADDLEDVFGNLNYPFEGCFPTFYKYLRNSLPDDNKEVRRVQLKFEIQNYFEKE